MDDRARAREEYLSIKGLTSANELAALYDLACLVPSGEMIVEVGCYHGKSTAALAAPGRFLVTLDPMRIGQTDGAYDICEDDVAALRRNLLRYPNARWWRMTTAEMPSLPADVGLLFIDGDHEWPWPRNDYRALSGCLSPGACVVWHDYTEAKAVQRAADEIIDGGKLRLVERIGSMVVCKVAKCSS